MFPFSADLIVSVSLVGAYLGVILVLAEAVTSLTNFNPEQTRKIVHIGAGNAILLAWWFEIPTFVIIFAAAIASCIAITSYFIPILPSITSVKRRSFGTFFYALSIGLLTAWFWSSSFPEYTIIGILIMTWGDGMAAIIGQRFGKHTYSILGGSKSWEGSLAMAGVSYLITTLVLIAFQGVSGQIFVIAGIVALCASALEVFSKFGIDNLSVPLGSAGVAFALHSLLNA